VTTRKSRAYANVTFLDEAVEDLRRIAKRSPEVVKEVLRLLKQLDAGELVPRRLQDYAKTGDLTDCGKIIVALPGQPEYRVVVRGEGGTFEICQVIAVEDRMQDLPYLLAGIRLGRIIDPGRRWRSRWRGAVPAFCLAAGRVRRRQRHRAVPVGRPVSLGRSRGTRQRGRGMPRDQHRLHRRRRQ
jgi:hypothetical protein